jgi:hypothetical protein
MVYVLKTAGPRRLMMPAAIFRCDSGRSYQATALGPHLNETGAVIDPLLAIAAGATIGAWARWGLGLCLNPLNANLPIGTLAANLLGGYGVGLAIAWSAKHPGLLP